jgi:tetratricopeptide (TPR) repeat protein
MRCLEKDRQRRYETANGVAADIARHLDNQPVVARPPSNFYRFQKLVRRHKFGFAATAVLIIVLGLGVLVSTREAIRATRAERTQVVLRLQAEANQKKSETEAAKATAISDFLQEMLSSANPGALKGSDYTVRQMLDNFASGAENQFRDHPEVEADVRVTLGRAYCTLGLVDKSQTQLERALVLRRNSGEPEKIAATLVAYAWTSFEQNQLPKGESQAKEALDIYRKCGTTGEPVIAALAVLQRTLIWEGRAGDVEAVTEEAFNFARKTPGVEFPELARMLHGLAEVRSGQARYSEAEALAQKAVTMDRRLRREGDLDIAWALLTLGDAQRSQNKLAEAEDTLWEALAIFRKQYSYGHKSVDYTVRELKQVLQARGDSAGVARLARDHLADANKRLERNDAVQAWLQRAVANGELKDWKTAAQDYEKAIMLFKDQSAAQRDAVGMSCFQLAEGAAAAAQRELAERAAGHAVALFKGLVQEDPTNADYRINLGHIQWQLADVLAKTGRREQAEQVLDEARQVFEQAARDFPAQPYLRQEQAFSHRLIGDVLQSSGRVDEAERHYRVAVDLYTALVTDVPKNAFYRLEEAYTTWIVAGMLERSGQFDLAETEYSHAFALNKKGLAVFPNEALFTERMATINVQLFELLHRRGKLTEARAMYPEIAERGGAPQLNDLAWSLATSADPGLRDGSNAVIFAEKAVAATRRTNALYLDTLAAAHAENGQFEKAINIQQEVLARLHGEREKQDFESRLKLFENHLPYRDDRLLAELARNRLTEGKFAEAEKAARECLAIREKKFPDDWRTFNARAMLGASLLGQKKYADAEPFLLSGYEGMKQCNDRIPAPGKPRLKEALQSLVQLYEATDRPAQASEWKQKLSESEERTAK